MDSKTKQLREMAPYLDAIGEHGMAKDAREAAGGTREEGVFGRREERRCLVAAHGRKKTDPRTIPWSVATMAYRHYGGFESLEAINRRGGFKVAELDRFVPDWRARSKRV